MSVLRRFTRPYGRFWRLVLVALVALASRDAVAKKKPRKDVIHKIVDDGAKACKATKPQRAQAHGSVTDLIHAVEEAFGPTTGTFPEQEEILKMFAAPTVDPKVLDAMRARRDVRHAQVADALVTSFTRIHRILDPTQRQKLVVWARQKVLGKQMNGLKQKLVVGIINTIVEGFLEQIGASDAERVAARGVRDRVMTSFLAARGDQVQQADELGAIFTADEVDHTALEKFREVHEQPVKDLLVSLQQAFLDLHAALTPEHRQKLVALVQNQSMKSATSTIDTDSDEGFQ